MAGNSRNLSSILPAAVSLSALAVLGTLALRSLLGPKKRNRVVVITGGSTGLGFGLAERFGRSGDKLVLSARNLQGLDHVKDMLLAMGAVSSLDDILLV